jgi:hypothetical protein
MAGGSITVENGKGDTLAVTITGGTWKAAADLSGGDVSFPDTITATKSYYVGTDVGAVTVSVKRRGVEIANTPDGARSVVINEGKNLTFAPGPDAGSGLGADEVIEPASNAVRLPEITLDEGSEVDPTGDVFALGVDADGDLAFYDGAAWVKVSLLGHTHD